MSALTSATSYLSVRKPKFEQVSERIKRMNIIYRCK